MKYKGKALKSLLMSASYNRLGVSWVVEEKKRMLVYRDRESGEPYIAVKKNFYVEKVNIDKCADIFFDCNAGICYNTKSVSTPSRVGVFRIMQQSIGSRGDWHTPDTLYGWDIDSDGGRKLLKAIMQEDSGYFKWEPVKTIRV